jgi:hypothetical protein
MENGIRLILQDLANTYIGGIDMAGKPVEHDPFATQSNGKPVDFDPFAPQKRSWMDVAGESLTSIPQSAAALAGMVYDVATDPVQAARGMGQMVVGGTEKLMGKPYFDTSSGRTVREQGKAALAAGGDYLKNRFGSEEAIKNTLATDPVGAAADLSLLFSGGSTLAARTPMLTRAAPILKTAAEYTNPLNAVTKPIASIISPNVAPEVKTLMNEGITPTTGQILGGVAKRLEEGLSSVPFVGDFIKNAQVRAVEDLNKAAFNRALKPIGKELPKDVTGREAVKFTGDTLGDVYEKLLPKMTVKADTTFNTELSNLKQAVDSGAINNASKNFFNKWIDTNVSNKFQGQGAITGETLKGIHSDFRNKINELSASTNNDERVIAGALKEAQDQFRQLVTRSNPQNAAELKAIDTGYANYKRVQNAASKVGAEEGVFSPAQLQNAVRATDKSKDKAKFAKGEALMQDLSESGKTVLGNKVPDSGTPYRTMAAMLASGGAGLLGYPGIAAGLAAAPVMYSTAGQKMMATLLAKRPAGAQNFAEQVRNNQQAQMAALLGAQTTPYTFIGDQQ